MFGPKPVEELPLFAHACRPDEFEDLILRIQYVIIFNHPAINFRPSIGRNIEHFGQRTAGLAHRSTGKTLDRFHVRATNNLEMTAVASLSPIQHCGFHRRVPFLGMSA